MPTSPRPWISKPRQTAAASAPRVISRLLLSFLLLQGTACDSRTTSVAAIQNLSTDPCTTERVEAEDPLGRGSVPQLTGRVVDDAQLLSPSAEAGLVKTLARLEQQTSDQLVVVTVPDLKGEAIESFGLRVGRAWGIGQKVLDNGVLLIVAPNERMVRIEVGCGLEGLLTDERAKAIIDDALLPRLRASDFEGAAETGVHEISRLLLSDRVRPRARRS
jgi:uncharacterized membrane protein YgcG